MEKFRVTVSHSVRERIVLDVEAPDAETLNSLASDVHAHACELPGWKFEWLEGTSDEAMRIEEHAERYDTAPDGTMKINTEGQFEMIEFPDDKGGLSQTERKNLHSKIQRALARVQACCLDDERDKARVIEALMEELG